MSKFIGVDGESYTEGTDHRYTLLANAYGQHAYNPDGLSTTTCLDFLLGMPKAKGRVFVGFGFNYDVNMILRDLSPAHLERLRTDQRISWQGYRLEWIPSKWFHVAKDHQHVRIHEVFGFFQSSFVNALEQWDIDTPEQIENMKAKRSDFTEEMKEQIISYCVEECNLLSELMGKLHQALKSVGLTPSNWIGAGSIAAALLRQHKITEHHKYDSLFGQQAHLAFLTAYFGGRVELFKQGAFPKLYDYDIVSAYPYAAQFLPSLEGAEVTEHKGYQPDPYGVYLCNWHIEDERLMPFPVRDKGFIYYPKNGRGWYHTPEVEAALAAYPEHINVEQSIIVHPKNSAKPFGFIPDVFSHRRKLKEQGHPGQKALKLGLNSLYGKLAQGVGYRDKLPPFQSYYWAGRITSATRAMVFRVARTNPDGLVMIATDGVFFDSDPPFTGHVDTDLLVKFDAPRSLGGFEREILTDAFVAQPGVYSAIKEDGTRYNRSRGFFSKEIDFSALAEGYAKDSFYHVAEYESTRFVGLLSALHTNSLDEWRTWRTAPRKLSLFPNRKFPHGHNPTVHLPPSIEVTCSQPYVPKGGTHVFPSDIDPLEYIQGSEQPMRQ